MEVREPVSVKSLAHARGRASLNGAHVGLCPLPDNNSL